jgi:FkbM family methyltransferase
MARRRQGLRFGLFEVFLIGLLLVAVTYRASQPWYALHIEPAVEELTALSSKYGRETNSEHAEEWIIRDFFQGKRGGPFLDVGANHYRQYSNTYYLETELGWSGIAVEPLGGFAPDYEKYRPRTRFRAFFVSDVSNEQAKMYVTDRHLVTSGDRSYVERHGGNAAEVTAPTITLNDLLESEKIERLDFMSMDIELSEPKALAGFDLARYRPLLVCIEGHPEVRQDIIDYFWSRGYVLVGRYLRADSHNLYFTPADHPGRPR